MFNEATAQEILLPSSGYTTTGAGAQQREKATLNQTCRKCYQNNINNKIRKCCT